MNSHRFSPALHVSLLVACIATHRRHDPGHCYARGLFEPLIQWQACSPQLLRFVANGEARLALEQCERESEREEEMARAGPERGGREG